MLWIWFIGMGGIGTLIGSFLNAWIWRTRHGKSVLKGRSICPSCKKTIFWRDLIPVVSFMFLRGRCRHCQQPISAQYPLVELWMTLAFVGIFLLHDYTVNSRLIWEMVVVTLLTAVFVYDLRYREILDRMTTIPACIFIPIILFFQWHDWKSVVLGVLVGAGFFLLQYVISRGQWIGGGDVRLGFFMGVVLGWPGIVVGLMAAYLIGACVSLVFIMFGKATMKTATPFGTYLSIGALIALFAGTDILTWYTQLLY